MSTLFFLFILSLSNVSGQSQIVLGDFSDCIKNGLPCGWDKFKSTKGVVVERDSLGYFVNIKSKEDVEGISRRIKFDVTDYSRLQWRWKVHVMPEGAREDVKKKNDCAAGIYIAFKGVFPFNHIIKYAWSTTLPEGTMITSPYSGNTKIFVVRSGPTHLNEWMIEKRDILSDYQKAFESSPPPVEGIALQSDSDNTGTCACADYADIVVSKE